MRETIVKTRLAVSGTARSRMTWRSRFAGSLLVVLLAALTACGGGEDPAPTPTAPAVDDAPATPGTATAPADAFGEIVWTTTIDAGTNNPTERLVTLPAAASTIYAVVPVTWVPSGTTITARWTYNDTPIQGMDATVQLPEIGDDSVWIEFHLQRSGEEPWPDGMYAIEISRGEEVVGAGTVAVEA